MGLWKKLVRNPSSMENIHNHYGADSFQCLGTKCKNSLLFLLLLLCLLLIFARRAYPDLHFAAASTTLRKGYDLSLINSLRSIEYAASIVYSQSHSFRYAEQKGNEKHRLGLTVYSKTNSTTEHKKNNFVHSQKLLYFPNLVGTIYFPPGFLLS